MSEISVKVNRVEQKKGTDYILDDLSFDIYQGEIVGLFGSNGCGKSTLHKILANREPASRGHVEINGITSDFNEFRSDVVLVTDSVELFTNRSVEFNFELLSAKYRVSRARFSNYLEVLEVDRKTIVNELSKGYQELIQLCIYFAIEVDVYLLDEPFNALDIFKRKFINHLFIDTISKRPASTIVLTTHLINEVEHLIDRVIYIKDHRVAFDISSEEIQYQAESISAFIQNQYSEEVKYERLLSND